MHLSFYEFYIFDEQLSEIYEGLKITIINTTVWAAGVRSYEAMTSYWPPRPRPGWPLRSPHCPAPSPPPRTGKPGGPWRQLWLQYSRLQSLQWYSWFQTPWSWNPTFWLGAGCVTSAPRIITGTFRSFGLDWGAIMWLMPPSLELSFRQIFDTTWD